MMAPQEPQYNSRRVLSFCMLHWPHAGHGGSPFTFGLTLGPCLGRLLRGTNQPFFGRFTFGTMTPFIRGKHLLKRFALSGEHVGRRNHVVCAHRVACVARLSVPEYRD